MFADLPPFARALALAVRRQATAWPELAAATAALVAAGRAAGHTRLALADHAGRDLEGVRLPAVDLWSERLAASGVADPADDRAPLAVHGHAVWLRRDWRAEHRVAKAIRLRLAAPPGTIDATTMGKALLRCFPTAGSAVDFQAIATAAALRGRLSVIAGGPGTGKTSTVARILALLAANRKGSLRIALCAPSGKAAARLGEALTEAATRLPAELPVPPTLPATTLHRLLAYDPRYDRFRRHAGHPLAADVVVLDEASMADLALVDGLLAALPATSRLIVLGDPGQLASVEAGYVLGDLCRLAGRALGDRLGTWCRQLGLAVPDDRGTGDLADAVVVLRQAWRFAEGSGIATLSDALRRGDGAAAAGACTTPDATLSARSDHPIPDQALDHAAGVLAAADPLVALRQLGNARLLTAVRQGPWGCDGLNAAVERGLRARHLDAGGSRYHGRPILITANDHRLGLANGDIGVVWHDQGEHAAVFAGAQGPRRFALSRLPAHDTAWAMTVHKAQGSEFDQVWLMLPPGDGPWLTRELLYTAVTRARRSVHLTGDATQLITGATRTAARLSGLSELLTDA